MSVPILVFLALLGRDMATAAQVRVVRYDDDRLTGIREVDVVLTTAGEVTRCVEDRTRLQQTAVETIRVAGLRATTSEKARSWFYSVLVSAHSVAIGGSCVTALTIELVAQVDGIPEADRAGPLDAWGSLLVGPLSLIHETVMVTSPAGDHVAPLQAALRARLGAIGARIQAANP